MGLGGYRIRVPAKAGITVSSGLKNSTGQAADKPLRRRSSQRESEENGFPVPLGKQIFKSIPSIQ